jgi:hypothetical protein
MQFPGLGKPALGVAFDSDLGNGIDDVLALALLYGFDIKGDARVISLSTTKSSLRSASLCDALAKFFLARPAAIGMADDGKLADDTPVLRAILDRKTPDGKPAYANAILRLNDTADPAVLIRNALTAQYDENCVVVLAGPATNLVRMMDLSGSPNLIEHKVKRLVVTAAAVKSDAASAKRLFTSWPSPIVVVGVEVGAGLPFPGSSIERDFSWAPAHPIVEAYRAFQPMPYDAPAPAMAAVLYAVHPDGYFELSAPGTFSVGEDGSLHFGPTPNGTHRYLSIGPAQKEKVTRSYVELVSAKPVARPRYKPEKKEEVPPPKPPEKPAA